MHNKPTHIKIGDPITFGLDELLELKHNNLICQAFFP